MKRYTPADPCPVCGTGSKGCSRTADGLQFCRGTPTNSDGWVKTKDADNGFGCYRQAEPPVQVLLNGQPVRGSGNGHGSADWQAKAGRFAAALDTGKRAALADALGLPPSAVDAVPLVGWKADEAAYTFPEQDGRLTVIGISRRLPDGAKKAMSGGKRGLTIPTVVADRTDPVDVLFVVEGPTDVMAMTAAGLVAVGRPNNVGGSAFLAELLRHRRYERIMVVGENDRKPDGQWPGQEGAEKVAKELAAALGKPVSLAMPPDGAKDVRIWLTDPARGVTPWADRGEELARRLTANAERIDPPAAGAAAGRWTPTLIRADQVTLREIRWHWRGRIPAGRLTLLSGRPGASKSVVTCFIAAITTTGGLWPDGGIAPKGSVIFLAAEDDPADTVCPRLKAAGADLSKVVLLDGKQAADPNDPNKVLKLSVTLADIDQIAAALDQTPDCKLIVIDPIGSYMGGRVDSHRDTEVRSVLAPLAQLARDRNVAVLLVAHTNKAMNQFADDSVLGSRAFVGIARSVLHFATDPDDKERKLLLPGKNNLAKEMPGLAYRVEADPAVIGCPPKVVWEDEPLHGVTADDYLGAAATTRSDGGAGRPQSGRAEAVALLEDVLGGGPQPVEVIRTEAKEAGVSWRTVERAKDEMGVVSKRQAGKFGDGKSRKWYWGFGSEWSPPAVEETVDRQNPDTTSQDTEIWRCTGETTQESADSPENIVHRQPPDHSGGVRDGGGVQVVDRQNPDPARTPPEFGEVGGVRETQRQTADSPVDRQNSSVLKTDPLKPRRMPKPTTPTGDPVTDPTAFAALLRLAGWEGTDVVRWADEQGDYVPPSGGYECLTNVQRVTLTAHLSAIVAEKAGER